MFSNRLKHIYILLLSIYSFVNILILNGDRLFEVKLQWQSLVIIITALCYGIWYINLGIQKYLESHQSRIHSLILQFLISILGISILSFLSVYITSVVLGAPYTSSLDNFKLTAGFTFRVNLFLNSINAIVHFNDRYREKAIEVEKFKSLSSQARYETLSNQINPHFLFNSLNVLSSLVHKDADLADEFIQKLSSTYRYVLNNRSIEIVKLSDELVFVKDYLDLLSIRFGDALVVSQVGELQKEGYIPPAVLQMLIENVIKHNAIAKDTPVHVEMKLVDDQLIVSNNIVPKNVKPESTGLGLSNISERYRFLEHAIEVEKTKSMFTVKLPIIKIGDHENTDH